MSRASEDQAAPLPGRGRILDMVLRDMVERAVVGKERYGTWLQAHNGRDALLDAYQEIIDLTVYLRQAIEERDGATPERRYRLVDELGDTSLGIYDSILSAALAWREMWQVIPRRIVDIDTDELVGLVFDGKLWIPTPL